MQDILAQMQEKLKATGQVRRVGSLGNDLDVTDVDKKRNSIIDVWKTLSVMLRVAWLDSILYYITRKRRE